MDPYGLDVININNRYGTTSYVDDFGHTVVTVLHRSGVGGITDPNVEGGGPTPSGSYRIEQTPVSIPNTHTNRAFCHTSGNCWWLPYIPYFETPNNRCMPQSQGGTRRCGMHPDGNIPGTQGCTGLTSENTSLMRQLIEQYEPSSSNPLPVIVIQ